MINWLKQLIKPRERRAPHSVLDYDQEYRRYRAQGLEALAGGKSKGAINALGRAVQFRPNDPVACFDLGRALQLGGKTEAARQAYLRALGLNPNLPNLKNALLALPPLPPTREDFHAGQQIKDQVSSLTFRVLEVRKGGFGAVYVVTDEESGTRWALKTFQAKYLWTDEDRKRFEREALTWLMLDRHPNVVNARSLMLIEGFPCLWLDYLPFNLAQGLQKNPLPVELAIGYGLQFCDGMFYAHQKMGIVHRDIKPSNCLLTEDLRVLKVTDFGLARSFAEAQEMSLDLSSLDPEIRSQLTCVAGTPLYMSPEQFRTGAALDTRSDIYSFGVMLYEMLTKDLPPVGFLAHSHITKSPIFSNVPDCLKRIILRCVQLDPSERPSDFGELRNELDAAHKLLTGMRFPFTPNPEVLEMDFSDWNDKAVGLQGLGHLEAACACYMRAIELNPGDSSIWGNYGGCLATSGRFSEALSCFDKGLDIDRSKPSLWCNKAYTLEALHRPEEARVCYQQALEIEPRNDVVWMNMGMCLADAGQREAALNCCDRSLEINQKNFKAWSNKANLLQLLGRYDEALLSCREGLKINPRYHPLWGIQSIAFMKLRRFEEALVACNRGLEIDANDPKLHKAKASILSAIAKSER